MAFEKHRRHPLESDTNRCLIGNEPQVRDVFGLMLPELAGAGGVDRRRQQRAGWQNTVLAVCRAWFSVKFAEADNDIIHWRSVRKVFAGAGAGDDQFSSVRRAEPGGVCVYDNKNNTDPMAKKGSVDNAFLNTLLYM